MIAVTIMMIMMIMIMMIMIMMVMVEVGHRRQWFCSHHLTSAGFGRGIGASETPAETDLVCSQA